MSSEPSFATKYSQVEKKNTLSFTDLVVLKLKFLNLDKEALKNNLVQVSDSPTHTPIHSPTHYKTIYSCGQLLGNLKIKIVNPETYEPLDHHIGEIWLQGPSIAEGYWGQTADLHSHPHSHPHSVLFTILNVISVNIIRYYKAKRKICLYLFFQLFCFEFSSAISYTHFITRGFPQFMGINIWK